jgi:transposase
MSNLDRFAAIVGIDWADKKHDICLRLSADSPLEFSVLQHAPEAIDDWAQSLRCRFGGQPVAVCIESRKVPLIYALLKYDFFVLFPVNPRSLAKYRQTWSPSGAKDDPVDAELIMDIVVRHPDRFSPWRPESPQIRALTQLLETRRRLVADRVRCTNRLTATLKQYYPQVLEWFDDKSTLVFCQFIERWPTLEQAKRARAETLRKFFHEHNARYNDVIERRIQAIKSALPLTKDPGVIEPNQFAVIAWVHQLALLLGHIRQFDREIAARYAALEDADLFKALPGAGPQYAPRLLVAFGEDRSRYSHADSLCRYAGIAPVTERSGKQCWVHWRYSCPKFLRQTFVEWANESRRYSFWAGAFYAQQREKGKPHQVAIRALAFKWIRILWRCWQEHRPYDEAAYLMALKAKGSPLIAHLAK